MFMMPAGDARILAAQNKLNAEEKYNMLQKSKEAAEKISEQVRSAQYYQKLLSNITTQIERAVHYGNNFITHTLFEGSFVTDSYKDHAKLYCYEKILKVKEELEKANYLVSILSVAIRHDDSGAYLNSGGECGSEKPYWTYDVIMRVEW